MVDVEPFTFADLRRTRDVILASNVSVARLQRVAWTLWTRCSEALLIRIGGTLLMISLLIAALSTVDMTKFEDAVWFVETSRREGMIWGDQGRSLGSTSDQSRRATTTRWNSTPASVASTRTASTWKVLNQDSASVSGSVLHRERLGRKPTNMDKARTWVGGPRGPWRKSSLEYARKVIRAIEDSPLASWGQAEYKTTIGGLK